MHDGLVADQLHGSFLIRFIGKEIPHHPRLSSGIESRDLDLPACCHCGTMRPNRPRSSPEEVGRKTFQERGAGSRRRKGNARISGSTSVATPPPFFLSAESSLQSPPLWRPPSAPGSRERRRFAFSAIRLPSLTGCSSTRRSKSLSHRADGVRSSCLVC
jgi:hypothetical protein